MPLTVTDIHVHIQPWEQLLPRVRERMKLGREDLARVERFNADPGAFLAHLDEIGVARAGLINYVAPDVMGFTAEANDFCARYAAHAPERLIPFGSVHPRYVRDAAAEMDRLRGRLGGSGLDGHRRRGPRLRPGGQVRDLRPAALAIVIVARASRPRSWDFG